MSVTVRRLVLCSLALAACSRDLTLPPEPGAGSIQGRVVYARAGQAQRVAADKALVTVLSTSLGAVTGPDGRFVVSGVTQTEGLLLIQVDLDGDGAPDRQALLDLAAIHAGPGRDLALGDVAVVENATVRGRARRADVTTVGGHAGIVIFVPQGPFLTQTADDGSYALTELPAGALTITYFHDGYDPQAVDGISLGGGQEYTVRDVNLAVAAGPGALAPGDVVGTVTFTPAAPGAAAATVSLLPVVGAALVRTPGLDGSFAFTGIPAGLYRLEAELTGYTRAVVANVLLAPGGRVALAVGLAQAGATVTPPPVTGPPPCVAGGRCDLPDACQVGQVNCATGSPVCASAGNALDGLSCGANAVCGAGACVPWCLAGASCPPANPCHSGSVACAGGVASCTDTGASLADGTACGLDRVCRSGSCAACVAGQACAAANPCHGGATSCATGLLTCSDTGLPLADGSSCGAGLACQAGSCGPCVAGKSCTPAGFACHAGQTSCATGRETCVDTGQVLADGTGCGADLVCGAGACLPCAAGASCAPANACRLGAIGCGTGAPVCVEQATSAALGAACGAARVCDGAGGCVACAAGTACAPPNPCHAGAIGCASGGPVCGDTGVALAAGTFCGTGQVCSAAGSCVACLAGAACVPSASPCHLGATSCASGAAACVDTGAALLDGANCGTDLVCGGGVCAACVIGAPCDGTPGHAAALAGASSCQVTATGCGTGAPVCAVTGSQPEGSGCTEVAGGVCRSGSCGPAGNTLRMVGTPHALPNQVVPALTLQLFTATGLPALTPATVTVTAPPGAVAPPPASTSAADGTVTFTALRLGRRAGAQHFSATAPGVGAPLDFVVIADVPADGTLIPLVNAAHADVINSRTSGPGPAQGASVVVGLAVEPDGTIYFSETATSGATGYAVKRLGPDGTLDVVAGNGSYGSSSSTGAALGISMTPFGLALDASGGTAGKGLLYIADYSGWRIRVVDLGSGNSTTVAGSGAACSTTCGDGGPATLAAIVWPSWVALGRETPPALYFAEPNSGVRRVDLVTGLISTVVPNQACSGKLVLLYTAPYNSLQGGLAFDENGLLFVGGAFCGTDTAGATVNGVARRNVDGTLTLVAGAATGLPIAGAPASLVSFPTAPYPAFDGAPAAGGGLRSNLLLSTRDGQMISRADGATGRFDVVSGSGLAGTAGDFGPAAAAQQSQPLAVAVIPGTRDLVVAGGNGHGLSLIVGGAAAAATALPVLSAGAIPSLWPQQPGGSVSAVLKDAAAAPLGSRNVAFALDPTGLPGGWIGAGSGKTDATGAASVAVRPGLALGSYGAIASFTDLHGTPVTGSPLALPYLATAPPAGTVFTAVAPDRAGATVIPGPGWGVGRLQSATGVVSASDGTSYFADTVLNNVYRVTPAGYVSLLAPASSVVDPWGLALDEAAGRLYVADPTSDAFWAVDTATGAVLGRVAGGGTASVDGPALVSSLGGAVRLQYAAGKLWFMDRTQSASRVRRVDLASGTIDTYLANLSSRALGGPADQVASCAAATRLTWFNAGGSSAVSNLDWAYSGWSSPAVSPGGTVYVSGYFCGPPATAAGATTSAFGIARVEPDGTLTLVAGYPGHGLAHLGAGSVTGFGAVAALKVDTAGNLWLVLAPLTSNGSGASIPTVLGYFAVDPVSGTVGPASLFHMVGRAASVGGEYVDESLIQFQSAWDISPRYPHWVSEQYSLRLVW